MSNRIPPSLKWLINKRARLLGEIISAEKELNDSIALRKKKLQILRKDLETIDSTIRLHDIPIEPSLIKPTPSSLDRAEWNKLSQKRKDQRPLLAVIVGRKDLYVELVPNSGEGSVMSPIK